MGIAKKPNPKPIEAAPGVWFILLPDHVFGSSSAYLLEDKVLTLVDSGDARPVEQGLLEEQLNILGYTSGDIKQIIYTHQHYDHTGGGTVLSQKYDILHFISSTLSEDLRDINQFSYFMPREIVRSYPNFESFLRQSLPGESLDYTHPRLEPIKGRIEGLDDGDCINLGQRQLQVIHTPGHGLHDIILHDSENGLLFSGDYLMKWETSLYFPDGGDVGTYLDSLSKVERMVPEVKLILPGHGRPFSAELRKLAADSRETILARCQRIVKYIRENSPSTAIEVYLHLYGIPEKGYLWAATFGALITSLRYLVKEGQISELEGQPGVFYL